MASKKRARATPEVEQSRARDVVLERIGSQMQVVVEAVTGLRETMDRRLTELEQRLSARISVLEDVVRKNSADLVLVRNEVEALRRDFDRRAELARVAALEERIARVEAKLGFAS